MEVLVMNSKPLRKASSFDELEQMIKDLNSSLGKNQPNHGLIGISWAWLSFSPHGVSQRDSGSCLPCQMGGAHGTHLPPRTHVL